MTWLQKWNAFKKRLEAYNKSKVALTKGQLQLLHDQINDHEVKCPHDRIVLKTASTQYYEDSYGTLRTRNGNLKEYVCYHCDKTLQGNTHFYDDDPCNVRVLTRKEYNAKHQSLSD